MPKWRRRNMWMVPSPYIDIPTAGSLKVQFLEKKKLLHPFFETNFLRTVRFAPRYIMIYEFLQKFLKGGTGVNNCGV